MNEKFNVAVVGATGAVGREMIAILESRKFPVASLRLLASERSAGIVLSYAGQEVPVELLTPSSFKGMDIALFSAGAKISQEFCPHAVKAGAVCIDNTSAFRMDPTVPLVVPEVNPKAVVTHQGIIANPNCSTIQMVVALKPIHEALTIKRVVVSTYQAVSGAGAKAVRELETQCKAFTEKSAVESVVFPYQIFGNVIPHIDVFLENGYTKEEMKMIQETQKIMGDATIRVTATTVRVPVAYGHSESVNIETEKKISIAELKALLAAAPSICVQDDPQALLYPMPFPAAGKDAVYVGRLREDISVDAGYHLWVVSDNLRKGAALNSVQIAELLMENPITV